MGDATETPPWWAAFPAPKSNVAHIEADEVLRLLEHQETAGQEASRDFLLVDVRRNDWEGGTIKSSINLPAQTLYQTRAVIHQLCQQAGIKRVIFYCGSSNGRGPRSANWLQDYFDDVGETTVTAVILKGGIKGWVRGYGGRMMDW
ncbi:CDC25-like phosphatase YCH1 [Colletotrichum sidae]|uniref:CDC25-like phosphatase YCH1 n=1 Tax=Colletotrichum sidae TaxID=1347389 RepID=A0A4R8T5W5_9PEZI|nr:CDC25-like phosphatase YCH1 [Colletotrichum sidae]